MTRSEIDTLDELVKDNGSNGLGWFKGENPQYRDHYLKLQQTKRIRNSKTR